MSIANQPVSPGPAIGKKPLIIEELPESQPTLAERTLLGWITWGASAAWLFCRTNPGWGISIALHAAVAIAIGIGVIRQDAAEQGMGIESGFGQHELDLPFDQIGLGDSVEVSDPAADTRSLSDLAEALRGGGEGQAAGDLGDLLNSVGRGSGTGTGAGDGAGDGADPGLGAAFFGSKGSGKTFVYIVDMSFSMEGSRFKRAIRELMDSIQKLKPEQQFYVFFFNDQTYPMFYPRAAKGLIPATKSNKDRALKWIRTREPGGMTNPMLSVQNALSMKPDVIFLLTDGEVERPADLREMILKHNLGSTIHTIAFENEDGAVTLESIATENKGKFRFVR